jgi:8-oxo-dGTP diphosphatase
MCRKTVLGAQVSTTHLARRAMNYFAVVAELVDAHDSKSCGATHESSSLSHGTMREKYFKFVSAVHLFLVKDEKVLLLRRFNTGYEDRNYSIPAGHIDGDERATIAMREAKEETGIIINEKDLRAVHVIHRISSGTHPSGSDERIDFFFEATKWQGKPEIRETDKCDDLSWFPINQLPQNVIPYVKYGIENYQNKILFSEFGWNETKT